MGIPTPEDKTDGPRDRREDRRSGSCGARRRRRQLSRSIDSVARRLRLGQAQNTTPEAAVDEAKSTVGRGLKASRSVRSHRCSRAVVGAAGDRPRGGSYPSTESRPRAQRRQRERLRPHRRVAGPGGSRGRRGRDRRDQHGRGGGRPLRHRLFPGDAGGGGHRTGLGEPVHRPARPLGSTDRDETAGRSGPGLASRAVGSGGASPRPRGGPADLTAVCAARLAGARGSGLSTAADRVRSDRQRSGNGRCGRAGLGGRRGGDASQHLASEHLRAGSCKRPHAHRRRLFAQPAGGRCGRGGRGAGHLQRRLRAARACRQSQLTARRSRSDALVSDHEVDRRAAAPL